MLAAWKPLIYSHYDFGNGLDFNIIQQLKKWLTLLGPVSKKVSAGNDIGIHSHCKKWIGKLCKECTFVCSPLWTNYSLWLRPIKFGTGRFLFWAPWLIGMSSVHPSNKMFKLVGSIVVWQNRKNFSTHQLTHFYWFIYVVEEQKRMLIL
jgi:hypothetical protein